MELNREAACRAIGILLQVQPNPMVASVPTRNTWRSKNTMLKITYIDGRKVSNKRHSWMCGRSVSRLKSK